MKNLAIEGGTPVRSRMLPYGRQWLGEDDIEAVVKVLRSDWITTGPSVTAFEEAFAAKVGSRYAIAVSSGTAALHAAAFAAGIKPDNEVVVSPMTFAASANCIRYQGGKAVFADVRSDTLNLDPQKAEESITPQTRAIITVDYAGQPSDIDELNALAARHQLIVIEDACHALGSEYRGKRVGSIAHMTVFSLHPVKHITTGEGGVITTDDPKFAERLRIFRNHGITTDHRQRENLGSWYYEMVDLGFNYRLTDFQCALGINQLSKLDPWLLRRRMIASRYGEAFIKMPQIKPLAILDDRQSAWHLYVIRLNPALLCATRAQIFHALRAENIGVNVHYIPVPWHPYYQSLGYVRGNWPIAEEAYEQIISLPMFPKMNDEDVQDVIDAVEKVMRAYAI
jgi:perosamine synthetase